MNAPGRPEEMIGVQIPDLVLPGSNGRSFSFRQQVGHGPLALFFYIHNGTPG